MRRVTAYKAFGDGTIMWHKEFYWEFIIVTEVDTKCLCMKRLAMNTILFGFKIIREIESKSVIGVGAKLKLDLSDSWQMGIFNKCASK